MIVCLSVAHWTDGQQLSGLARSADLKIDSLKRGGLFPNGCRVPCRCPAAVSPPVRKPGEPSRVQLLVFLLMTKLKNVENSHPSAAAAETLLSIQLRARGSAYLLACAVSPSRR